MFTEIIKNEIREALLAIEDIENLLDLGVLNGWTREDLIDERLELRGKIRGLKFALDTYQKKNKLILK